jgi:hypothetical protein
LCIKGSFPKGGEACGVIPCGIIPCGIIPCGIILSSIIHAVYSMRNAALTKLELLIQRYLPLR